MMKLFNELQLVESHKASQKEIDFSISLINSTYNEWKKVARRINAVDLITTSINKLSKISPDVIDKLHDAAQLKLTTIIMRCMDMPIWKDINSKKTIYKKIFPILSKLQNNTPNTDTGGNLRDVVMTRLSAVISFRSKSKVFICYEPSVTSAYLNYLFDKDLPEKTYKMQSLSFPEDFDTLVNTLQINLDKGISKFNRERGIK